MIIPPTLKPENVKRKNKKAWVNTPDGYGHYVDVDISVNLNTTAVSSNLCIGGHVIIWAGNPHYEIPDGTPCSCGMTTVKRVTCPTCGHIEMKMVEKEGS